MYAAVPEARVTEWVVDTFTSLSGEAEEVANLANFSIASVFLSSCSSSALDSLATSCAHDLFLLRSLRPSICLECRGRCWCALDDM